MTKNETLLHDSDVIATRGNFSTQVTRKGSQLYQHVFVKNETLLHDSDVKHEAISARKLSERGANYTNMVVNLLSCMHKDTLATRYQKFACISYSNYFLQANIVEEFYGTMFWLQQLAIMSSRNKYKSAEISK